MIALIGTVDAMQSTVHHVSLGAYASQGLTASSISGSVIIGIMNGQVADNLVVDAAQFSKNLNINNAGTGAYAQESGHSTVTGGSGNDMLRFGAGTAKINFAASALANGQDSIYANPGNTSLTLDFSQFIQQPTATSLTDLSHTGLDLSGATNIGLACGKASISMADISLTDEVGKIKLEHVLNHANNIRQVRQHQHGKRHVMQSSQRLRQLLVSSGQTPDHTGWGGFFGRQVYQKVTFGCFWCMIYFAREK